MKKQELTIEQDTYNKVNNKFKLCTYKGNIWGFVNDIWTNLDEVHKNETRLMIMMNAHIRDYVQQDLGLEWNKQQLGFNFLLSKGTRNIIDNYDVGMQLKNLRIKPNGNIDLPTFSTSQIKRNYLRDFKPSKNAKKKIDTFLKVISGGNEKWLNNLLQVLSTCLTNINYEVFVIILGEGGEGKNLLLALLESIIGENNKGKISANSALVNNYDFAERGIKDKTFVLIDELPERLKPHSTERIKSWANKEKLSYNAKNSNEDTINNIGTFIATTNSKTKFNNIDDALKQRIMRITMGNIGQSISNKLTFDTSELFDEDCLDYLFHLLVKSYIEFCSQTGNRIDKFIHYDNKNSKELWAENENDDEVLVWIKENMEGLDGTTATEAKQVFKYKKSDLSKSITWKIVSKKMIDSKLFEKKKSITTSGTKVLKYVKVEEVNNEDKTI